jgi:hypothetical protein
LSILLMTTALSLSGHAAAAAAGAPPRVDISLTGQPRSFLVTGRAAQITGYGHAQFGMRVDEIRAMIAVDFPAGLASLKDEVAPATRNHTLTLVLPELVPGPCPATINYVFGATSQRLIAVNVAWQVDGQATTMQRLSLVEAAKAVGAGFAGSRWPLLQTTRGNVLPDGALIVFSGKDERGAGLEIRLDGVDIDLAPRQKSATTAAAPQEHRVAPPGPARLRVAFVANTDNPDVYRIPDGAF